MAKTKKQGSQAAARQELSMAGHIRKEWRLYSLMALPILYYVVFKYVPVLGNIIAFRRYKGGPNILGEYWVGFRYFEQFMTDSGFWQAFWNTLRLSIGYLLVRFPATLIFALLLNEIRKKDVEKDDTDRFLSAAFHFPCRSLRHGKRAADSEWAD